ncbi:putative UDP-glucuronosyl/UDP-glucosyltransferase [Helianthus annuus]|nr:putative UDP-glucuronosyl/UDP-glucosyltransferase [Helianthus annuus]
MVCTPKIRSLFPLDRIAKCLLLTTTYELEADAIDEIVYNTFIPVYVLGPNIPYFWIRTSFPSCKSSYYSWLESKPPRSVLYVSLGSLVRVKNNQIAEILVGLKQSGVAFMWAAGGEALRLSGDYGSDGLVVERCDRLRVLSHSSVGGFMSHCGWNSTKESLFSGVPVLLHHSAFGMRTPFRFLQFWHWERIERTYLNRLTLPLAGSDHQVRIRPNAFALQR